MNFLVFCLLTREKLQFLPPNAVTTQSSGNE